MNSELADKLKKLIWKQGLITKVVYKLLSQPYRDGASKVKAEYEMRLVRNTKYKKKDLRKYISKTEEPWRLLVYSTGKVEKQ